MSENIEDADIVVDLSGGKLALQQYQKRVKELQAENTKWNERAMQAEFELEELKAELEDLQVESDSNLRGWESTSSENTQLQAELEKLKVEHWADLNNMRQALITCSESLVEMAETLQTKELTLKKTLTPEPEKEVEDGK